MLTLYAEIGAMAARNGPRGSPQPKVPRWLALEHEFQREAFAHGEKIIDGMRAARNADEFVAEKG